MKKLITLIAVGLAFIPILTRSAETAQARWYCMSLRIQQSTDDNDFFSLALSTFPSSNNGELGPYFYFFDPNTTHSAYLDVVDQLFFDEYSGAMDLNVPDGGDSNGDGFPDFFDTSVGVTASSSGTYSISGIGSGTVTASWDRFAGGQAGSCVLTLHNTSYGNLVFTTIFEVLEYRGPLSYVPGSNTVTGVLNVAQTGYPANTLQGNLSFNKSVADKYNQLTLQAGSLSNAASQTLSFLSHTIRRDAPWPTNYYGTFEFNDGEPNTAGDDYYLWEMLIDDTNDVDHDGIPDFSDDPSAPTQKPVLNLTRGSTNLLLKITGSVGHLHTIQEVGSLKSTNWVTVTSVTLSNSPQTVSLPLPSTAPKFWRVLTQ
jgi:hypothetical protein